nr:DUF2298 domain-containing protein [Chloroflexota bacterium]
MGIIALGRLKPLPFGTSGRLAILSLLLAALALRLFGLNWDQGQYLHPDERYVIQYVMQGRIHFDWPPDLPTLLNPDTSGLNPRSNDPETGQYREFAYGALPLLITDAAAELLTQLTSRDWHASDRVYLLGRTLSALLDTVTVLIVYLIGRRAFSVRVGLFAAALAALAPMSIQLAHFLTTDSWLTLFVALCLLFSINAGETGMHRWFAAAGASFGLAMATKGSVFTLVAIIFAAVLVDLLRRRWRTRSWIIASAAGLERLALAGACSVLAFGAFEPFALIDPEPFLRSLETQANIVRGIFDVPFTRQYVGTTPAIYQLEQLVRWGLGPAAGILAIAGLPITAWGPWRRPNAGTALVLVWVAVYAVVIVIPETKFLRYLAPIVPVLAVTGGVALDAIWRFFARRWNVQIATTAITLALLCAGLWTTAFSSVYAAENPRIAASRWIYANVQNGASLSGEYWDDGLPRDFGPGLTFSDRQFERVGFDLYRDYPSLADLTFLGEALLRDSLSYPLGRALLTESPEQASGVLARISGVWSDLPQTDRDELALLLERAGNRISASNALRDGVRGAANGLRTGGEPAVQALTVLSDAIETTARDEASTVLYESLARTDYYILSSNRVSSAVPQLPWRYPVQIRFYELLRDGSLGFHLVADFTNYPRLGPIEFGDDSADESFLNYDHPHVLIYEKRELVSETRYAELMADVSSLPVTPSRQPPEPTILLDVPVGELPVVDDARWSAALTDNSLSAFFIWVALLFVLQLAGWPIAILLLGKFVDGGWGFARLITVLVSGYLVWLGASLELFEFRAVWAWVSVLAVMAVGWAVLWRSRGRLWSADRTRRGQRVVLVGELVFWAVFGLFVAFRYFNPDSWHPTWGGEKPMEFAHLNAILRSAHFPPFDPWYSGGYINYYYYGIYLVAFCLKLTGIPSEIAFNLAQPTIMGLLASGGFSLTSTLAYHLSRRRGMAVLGGLLGTLLLSFLGNLDSFTKILTKPAGPVGDPFGLWTWGPSRAIPNAITEFPYFTGLYADLHAHVVALPMTVLALALAYSLATGARDMVLVLS